MNSTFNYSGVGRRSCTILVYSQVIAFVNAGCRMGWQGSTCVCILSRSFLPSSSVLEHYTKVKLLLSWFGLEIFGFKRSSVPRIKNAY